MKKYENTKLLPRERAEALLEELSLDEKIAQINCYCFTQKGMQDRHVSDLAHGIGVVSCLETRGTTAEQAILRINAIQKTVMENSPHHIPAIFHMEGLCGLLFADASCFPAGIARGASFDAPLEREIGKVVGDEAAAANITHVFAPVLDVTRDARFGRMYESYGEDETLVAAMGVAYAEGVQDNSERNVRVEGVAKHFLGFHKSAGGQHGSDCAIGERELREVYAKPFEATFRSAHLRGVMPCYNDVNGELVSLSKNYLTNLLRDELGFDGVVVSDYCAIMNAVSVNRVAATAGEAGLRALSAGMDVEEQFPYGFGYELKEKFASGEADVSMLDRAVLRVLEAKFRMGLFEHPFAEDNAFDRKKEHELSFRSALEAMVLLKNDGILPLKTGYKKIAVIGYHAGTARGMFGGYTNFSMYEGLLGDKNTMAGLVGAESEEPTYPGTHVFREDAYAELYEKTLRAMFPDCRTLTEELQLRYPASEIVFAKGYDYAGTDEGGFSEALKACEEADLIVLALGGKCGTGARCSMGENVNAINIGLPPAQEKFIRLAAKFRKPMVGVHFDGRPVSSDAADECLNAILECWNPSQFGAKAAVSILAGDRVPSGKLPVTVVHSAGQLPLYFSQPFGSGYHPNEFYKDSVYMDSPYRPRYYFGFGLSYTQFDYAELCIDKLQAKCGDVLHVSAAIQNVGEYDGEEIVQLYMTDTYASVARPSKQLLGFARVPLVKGECKRVEFMVDIRQFAFLDEDMRWKIECGEIVLMLGSSSEDIRLSGSVYILEDAFIGGKDKAFFATVASKQIKI